MPCPVSRQFLACLAFLCSVPLACGADPSSKLLFDRSAIEAEFAAYYANPGASTPLVDEVGRAYREGCGLDGVKPPTCDRNSPEDRATRERAIATLVAMMDMLRRDELEGRGTKVVETPYWGGGSEKNVPPRELRRHLANKIDYPREPVQLPFLKWIFANEDDEFTRHEAVTVLLGIQGPEADALLVQVVRKNISDEEELVRSLTALAQRAPDDAVAAARLYAQDVRVKLRSASREVLAARGEEVPAFDPSSKIADFRTQFAGVLALLPEPIRNSRLIRVQVRPGAWRGPRGALRGFELASADPKKLRILTTSLDFTTVDRGDIEGDVVEVPLADEATRVAGLRASATAGDRDAAHSFSRDGSLTGQFEPRGISGYEVLLASELFERGDAANAARVFLPPVEAAGGAEGLFSTYRSRLAVVLYHSALEHFAGDRDYVGAAKLARIVADKFPAFPDHRDAARLADQLPRRLDEFHTFTLPSQEQWEVDSQKMSRKEKIDWLCDHVRLVNAFQDGQPGGLALSGPLFAEPSGMENAAWAIRYGGTEVLNPIRALEDMALFPADIPIFAAHLGDDRLLPSVEFWRDFAPTRKLYTVADIVGYQINDIAEQQLIPRGGADEMDEKARAEVIVSVLDWSKRNETRDEKARLLDALRKDQEWYKARAAAKDLADMHVPEAAPLVLAYLDRKDLHGGYDEREIIRTAAKLDGSGTAALIEARLRDGGAISKLEAGLVVVKWGNPESGYRALREALQRGGRFLDVSSAGEAVAALLSSGSSENEKAARVVFEKEYLVEAWSAARKPLLDAFGDRCGLVLRFYRSGLDILVTQRIAVDGRIEEEPKGFRFGREVIERYGSSRVGLEWPERGTREAKDATMAKLRAWLDAQISRSETCTTS